ncbi:unnamed protein product [Rotaria socialis]|uniref:Phosphoacetylglucosamine mutase n=1 Tax=Rotaria socialis TaxID=392032 RepID=A0A821SKF7_9BILA|nr:unnamed protein product [Rotaria socialis]
MGEIAKEKLAALLLEYPKPSGIILGYGTAGFRARADTLPWIMIRIGLLASLRSKVKKGEYRIFQFLVHILNEIFIPACIGAMVTASHNPEHDNGVKLIDPFGEMLNQSWEIYASNLSSLDDSIDALWNYLEKLMTQLNVQLKDKATVAIAYDTRQSSPLLSHIVQRAAEIFNTNIINYELMTTPQLHYTVRCYNDNELYGRCTEMTPGAKHLEQLAIDAANGIGAQKLVVLQQRLSDLFKIEIFNDGTQGRLNEKCGADYVKLYQKAPEGLPLTNYPKYCSIDGDADRLIYYFIDQNQHFRMLDGDRFSVLFASFISKKLKEAKLIDQVKIGVIQTAYANGSSTNYVINTMNVPVACVPTGVKHLHHKALDFDVGIYFEANGHGTVLFSDDLKTRVKSVMEDENRPDDEKLAAKQLHVFIDIINETVGDALADLLATEAILCLMNLSIEGWLDLYHDLPQRQLKVAVKDRTMIQTTDAERRCTAPAHLQDCIDELVSKYPSGRSFVRPSGTEDIVRVYAEATTQADADQLADEVRKIVQELTK